MTSLRIPSLISAIILAGCAAPEDHIEWSSLSEYIPQGMTSFWFAEFEQEDSTHLAWPVNRVKRAVVGGRSFRKPDASKFQGLVGPYEFVAAAHLHSASYVALQEKIAEIDSHEVFAGNFDPFVKLPSNSVCVIAEPNLLIVASSLTLLTQSLSKNRDPLDERLRALLGSSTILPWTAPEFLVRRYVSPTGLYPGHELGTVKANWSVIWRSPDGSVCARIQTDFPDAGLRFLEKGLCIEDRGSFTITEDSVSADNSKLLGQTATAGPESLSWALLFGIDIML